jgi:hypothetical protein
MEISLSVRTFGCARVVLDARNSFKLAPVLRVEHLESETVPVDDDGKVVPNGLVEWRLEQHAAAVRVDAEHIRGGTRQCVIKWGPWRGTSGQSNSEEGAHATRASYPCRVGRYASRHLAR